ncbi:MAG TPA: pirin family protein [Sandaracinaceae bacterium LLY-WYZ-13_1]|nr:pirin family protein [Sandaracinaceae bacterium LLY-WYZ-13_1]
MSWMPAEAPRCGEAAARVVETVIEPRRRDLGGGFSVRRVLPASARRMVGPFIFFDEMGPVGFELGGGLDVRPHPHIGLSTVTYLFEGEILHRDSLGTERAIRPGAVNWMRAGRGIVHSERTAPERRPAGGRLHGIQAWVALPKAHEEAEPSFAHHPAESLPRPTRDGARLTVIAGEAFGARAPVETLPALFYVHAELDAGADVPLETPHEERAAYVVDGAVRVGGERYGPGVMLVFAPRREVRLEAEAASRVMLLGGAPADGPRTIVWNFVSSRPERIEQAKDDWRAERFETVPADEAERIPLPEGA